MYLGLGTAAVLQLTAAVVAAVEPSFAAGKVGTAGDKPADVGPCNHRVDNTVDIDPADKVAGPRDTSALAHLELVAASPSHFCCHHPPVSLVPKPPFFVGPSMDRTSALVVVEAEC